MRRSTARAIGYGLGAFVVLATLYVMSHDGARMLVAAPDRFFAYFAALVFLLLVAAGLVES